MPLTLYHNPRCSKSRAALALIQEKGVEVNVVTYLQDAPSTDELARIVSLLGLASARDMMRTGQSEYKELALFDVTCEQSLLSAINEHPILLERPILVSDTAAAIGRPTENLLALL